jgi:hypothetical protein
MPDNGIVLMYFNAIKVRLLMQPKKFNQQADPDNREIMLSSHARYTIFDLKSLDKTLANNREIWDSTAYINKRITDMRDGARRADRGRSRESCLCFPATIAKWCVCTKHYGRHCFRFPLVRGRIPNRIAQQGAVKSPPRTGRAAGTPLPPVLSGKRPLAFETTTASI